MNRPKDKHVIFQINPLSLRNFTSYFNFIVLIMVAVFTLGGGIYAYVFTPKFEASGLLKSMPYAPANELSMNTLKEKRDTTPQTIEEMDLINTHSLFKKVVDDLHLNINVKVDHWPPWYYLKFFFTQDNFWKTYLSTGLNDHWSDTGQLLVWSQVNTHPVLFGKKIKFHYLGDGHYQLFLPDSTVTCEVKKPCVIPDVGEIWTLDHIYLHPNQRLNIIIKNPDKMAEELRARIKIIVPNIDNKQGDQRSPLMQSLIQVSFVDQNPILAAAIINKVLESALFFSKNRRKEESMQAAQLLKMQQKLIYTRLSIANNELAHLKNRHGPLSPDLEADYLFKRLGFIQETLIALQQKEQDFKLRMTSENVQLKNLQQEIKFLTRKENKINTMIKYTPLQLKRITILENEVTAQLDLLKNTVMQEQLLSSLSKLDFSDLQIMEKASIPVTPISYSRAELIIMLAIIGLILGYILATAIV